MYAFSYQYLSFALFSLIFLFGVITGSFLNSWIWRHRENIRVSRGRSICVHCRRKLVWYENIPILSFLFLGGRCSTCRKRIPPHYIVLEFGMGLLFLFTAYHFVGGFSGDPFAFQHSLLGSVVFYRNLAFVIILAVIFFYDYLYSIIPTCAVWLGGALGVLFNYFCLGLAFWTFFYGALIGGGFFFLQYAISKGKWIGGGDVRMGIMMGLWLGWQLTLLALALSYIMGAFFAVALMIAKRKKMNSQIPFGTFLSVGTFAALFWGEQILDWYLGLIVG